MPLLKSILKYNSAWFVWSLFIVYVLLIRQSSLPKFEFDWVIAVDKLAHGVLFFVLILLLLLAFLFQIPQWFGNRKGLYVLSVFSVLFGLFTELLQLWVTTDRNAEATDVLADISGVVAGGVIFEWLVKKKLIISKK